MEPTVALVLVLCFGVAGIMSLFALGGKLAPD